MKRSTMSMIVIFMTIVSVVIMLYSSGSINFKFESIINLTNATSNKVITLSNSLKDYARSISKNREKKIENAAKHIGIQDEVPEKNESEKQGKSKSQQKILNEQVKDTNANGIENKGEEVKEEVALVNSAKKYNNIVVFKVPKEDIKNSISPGDKAKLLALANKISPFDYLKIENYIKDQDVETAVVNTIVLLKTRLSKKDYEKLREVVEKYIDIDKLEKALAS